MLLAGENGVVLAAIQQLSTKGRMAIAGCCRIEESDAFRYAHGCETQLQFRIQRH